MKDTKTQRSYVISLNNLENFSLEKHAKSDCIPELKKATEEEVFDFLQAWINWNKKLSARTVKGYFSQVKRYLHYRGIKLHVEDIKAELDFKNVVNEELYPLSLEDIQTIFKEINYKAKVTFMCQMSALMRIGETVQLRKKHLILDKQNIIVKIPASIAKFKKGRTTFFSKKASKLLRPILRVLNDDDLVFGSSENDFHAELNISQTLRRILIKVGLDMKYESTGRFMINTHCFRAYSLTKISRHDPNFAKKIAGQKGYLLQYDRMTDKEKLELYQKFEIDLVIDNTEKLKAENENKAKTITELEVKSKRITFLEREFKKLVEAKDEGKKIEEAAEKYWTEDPEGAKNFLKEFRKGLAEYEKKRKK